MTSMAWCFLFFLIAPHTITAEHKLRQEMVHFIVQNIASYAKKNKNRKIWTWHFFSDWQNYLQIQHNIFRKL